MRSLGELQAAFKRYLLAADNEESLCAEVMTGNAPAAARLDVYRHAYNVRLQDALAHDFPALLAAAGEKKFGRLVAAYLRERPSKHPSLRWLGEPLADWLRASNEPALADIAALEWAVLRAFDAPDAAPLTPAHLSDLPPDRWPELRLSLHPSVSLLSVAVNARAIWSAVRSSEAPPALTPSAEWLIVWRAANGPAVQSISRSADLLLRVLGSGSNLGSSCEALAKSTDSDKVPTFVAEQLHEAATRGWLGTAGHGGVFS
jgi:hypothetical protein